MRPMKRSRSGHSSDSSGSSSKAGSRPGACCKQVPGFFVLKGQPSRLRKDGWVRWKERLAGGISDQQKALLASSASRAFYGKSWF